jgi:hypothetical protein
MLHKVPVLNHKVWGFVSATEARVSPFAVTKGSSNFCKEFGALSFIDPPSSFLKTFIYCCVTLKKSGAEAV